MDQHRITSWPTQLYLGKLTTMPFGKERRKYIMDAFDATANSWLAVNCEFRPQLKADPDLRRLIKSRKLKVIRINEFSYRGNNFRRTLLVKGKEV